MLFASVVTVVAFVVWSTVGHRLRRALGSSFFTRLSRIDHHEVAGSDFVALEFIEGGDGTGRLHVHTCSHGFAGRGSAYFDALHLAEFAASLNAFPLPADGLTLAGGFGNPHGPGELEQELVGLRFYRVGGRGQVGVGIHLSGQCWHDTRPESVHEVRLELLTTYERLRTFSRDFLAVARRDDVSEYLEEEVLL